ncbi:hypothetical protein F5Y19DRAFT_433822 [Xylariaceae sp. FL1651]|nr:hypothetical protein F5Y19DRAFT_433822 [Xylariaceae sp. FL1651]
MLVSILTTIGVLAIPALSLPAATSGLDKRQEVNVDWTVTNWQTTSWDPKHTVRFAVGAPDAYISGFYGFSVWCEDIPYNVGNYTFCVDYSSYHILTKVSNVPHSNLTEISIIHKQIEPNRVSIASGSAKVVPSSWFTVHPTKVRIGI